MFKQLLQLNLNEPHDKQTYSLKRNQLRIKQTSQSLKFDAICYSSQDIMSKIVYEIVTLVSKRQVQSHAVTVTFNYNLQAQDLILLIQKLLTIKIFSKNSFQLGHFQIKNGHISDYNKNSHGKTNTQLIDDLDQFQKEIDNCLKLQRLWKINQYLSYKEISVANTKSQVVKSGKKFGKRTNEFFVLEIERRIKIILIILPRSRDFIFTKQQQKQIEELYIINKHSGQSSRKNICFITSIAQIINNYIQNSELNVFVSCFPQQDKDLIQSLKLSLRLGNPHQQEIKQILENYNKDKWDQLEHQADKMKKKLKDIQYNVKVEQDNIQRLIKIYSKTFSKTFSSIQYLKSKSIKNVGEHIHWLKQAIKQKEEQVETEEAALKQIHKQIIMDEERHLFYLNKIKKFKEGVVKTSASVTPKSMFTRHQSMADSKENIEPTEEELMYFYDPNKEVNRYREGKEEQIKNKINQSNQKKNFIKLMEEAKHRLGKTQITKFEHNFYQLIED